MVQDENSQERREFFRIAFSTPLRFKNCATTQDQASLTPGTSENISQTGILFQTKNIPPQLSSIVWMALDIRTLKICQEIENRALIFNNGILGRVVRVEEDLEQKRVYDVGVCFLKRSQKDTQEVQQILAELSVAD